MKKKIFNKKILVIYFNEEYFFEIDSKKKSKNNYFPYFVTEKNLNTFERWIKSIFLTENKNKKIVRNLEDGITERKELKKIQYMIKILSPLVSRYFFETRQMLEKESVYNILNEFK